MPTNQNPDTRSTGTPKLRPRRVSGALAATLTAAALLAFNTGGDTTWRYTLDRALGGGNEPRCLPVSWLVVDYAEGAHGAADYGLLVTEPPCWTNTPGGDTPPSRKALAYTYERLQAGGDWEVVEELAAGRRQMMRVTTDLSLREVEETARDLTGLPGWGEYEMWHTRYNVPAPPPEV